MIEELETNTNIIKNYLQGLLPALLSLAMQVILAIVILFIGTRIIKWITKVLRKSLERGRMETGVVTFLCSLVKYALYFVLVMIILSQFGVTTGSVVAVLGSAGLTAGLALQGSLSNFAGGVLILLLKPFVVGDYILDNASGQEGTVTAITIFYTKILTVDNKMTVIPNGALSNSSITNYSCMDKRRVDVKVGISYDSNIGTAKEVLAKTVAKEDRILQGEPVDIIVTNLGESSVDMEVRVWVKTEDFWNVKWSLTEKVKLALDENAISIPFPQLDVKIKSL